MIALLVVAATLAGMSAGASSPAAASPGDLCRGGVFHTDDGGISKAKIDFAARCNVGNYDDQKGHKCSWVTGGWQCEGKEGTSTSSNPEPETEQPNPGSNTSLRAPTLRSVNYFYTQAVASGNVPFGPPRGVSISWDRVHTYADGVNIYRDNVYQTTVKNDIRWKDPDGRPDSVYYLVAVRGDDYSQKSEPVTATVDWFREHDHSDAEARIRGRLYSSHLTDFSADQIVEAAAAAFGDRPDLISKWHRDAGGEIHPYRANAGLVECSNTFHDTKIYLPNNPGAFLTVHELAHVIDCSKSGQLDQGGDTDGIGAGMYSWDEARLVAERERLWDLERSGNRPNWLREYSFTDRGEFFADVSAFFLTDEWRRVRMAVEAPVLYDTLRSYYYKPQWAPAAEIAFIANP